METPGKTTSTNERDVTRRSLLKNAGVAAIGAAAAGGVAAQTHADHHGPVAKNGRIKQSMVWWCYREKWPTAEAMAQAAVKLGLKSIELGNPDDFPVLKKHGLTCAILGSHGFVKGFNNPKYWDECIVRVRERIDLAAAFGCKNVITFTGMREDIPDDVGIENCVEGYRKVIDYAEQKGVTLALEMLNTRDDTHRMKGHPGYQGDHTEYCIEILERVNSQRLRLLFDIYHVQIMDGDVIRRIHQHAKWIAHIHTAGNPGRGELDENQEINYPPIMRALLEVGYEGYVGQEFIPQAKDAWDGMVEAVKVCDV